MYTLRDNLLIPPHLVVESPGQGVRQSPARPAVLAIVLPQKH